MFSFRKAFWHRLFLVLFIVTLLPLTSSALSVDEALSSVRQRLVEKHDLAELKALSAEEVLAELSAEERISCSTEHIRFTINCPARVYVLYDQRFEEQGPFEAFWLKEGSFEREEVVVDSDGDIFVGYGHNFEAGTVGLGINSFSGNYLHYFIAVKALDDTDTLVISDTFPDELTVKPFQKGIRPYTHPEWDPIERYSEELEGATLLQTDARWRRTTKLLDYFIETEYPASAMPDNIVLCWSGDPRYSQSIQWRTSPDTKVGAVAYMKKRDYMHFTPATPDIIKADSQRHKSMRVLNQPVIYLHSVTLTDLEADTSYVYAVGDGSDNGWSELAEFSTAPEKISAFSFIYMGDVQVGYPRWRSLLMRAWQDQPDARFYMLAGDNVNRGVNRDEWDSFFTHGRGVFDQRPVVPALGNHEYIGGDPELYRDFFMLPENGPEDVVKEHCYSFEYSNALFVVLDTNLLPEEYVSWLDKTLDESQAVWKFVMMHHPLYSSGEYRDNKWLRDVLLPVFDRHHVDMVFQGHDHTYLRTGPMRADEKVDSPAEGTIYVLTVSGTKLYKLADKAFTEVGYEKLATYQVINLQLDSPRLVYRAYDVDGNQVDEVIIEK